MSAFRPNAYALPVSPDDVRAEFPDFSFDTYLDPPGQVWEDFMHETDEFVAVVAGRMDIEVGSERRLCVAGDLVLIPARTRHTLRTTNDAGSVWHYGYGRFGDAHGRS